MKNTIFSFALMIILAGKLLAQDETIFKALTDEMGRNMEELSKLDDYTAPFFMEYGLNDYDYDVMYASLGSVIRSVNSKGRSKSLRLMVGDYDLCDENFKDNTSNSNHNDGNIALPLENDYLAIRRSFWITTNNVFKSASELYRNKLSAMKLKGLTKKDLPASDFSKENPVVLKVQSFENDIIRDKAANNIKEISLAFGDYSEIHFSQVTLFHINALRYMVNSEGTKMSVPFNFYIMHIGAVMYDIDQHQIWQQLIYYANSFDELPTVERTVADIKLLSENLYAEAKADKYDEKYIGPIMFEDFAVIEENIIRLFGSGNESLIGNRPPLVNNQEQGLVIPSQQTWEQRIGKRVIDKKLSITDKSSLKEYKGIHLMGNFAIDNQGVKPADSLILVDEGILKSQLVDRTPTTAQNKSTGHNRLGMSDDNVISSMSPGVVYVKTSETTPYEEMKQKLIQMAKEEGLDHVFVIRPLKTSANNSSQNYYKINVETGEESLVRGLRINWDIDDLRDVEYVSDDVKVYNTLFYRGGLGYTRGVPVSFISPGSIILKESQISGDANPIKGELPVVPSPLTILQE